MPKKKKDITYYEAVGRRRESSARVRMYIVSKRDKTVQVGDTSYKQGDIIINDKKYQDYFPAKSEQMTLLAPLSLTENTDRFVTCIHVNGGGKTGQVEAIVHALSRAVCIVEPEKRDALKKAGLLTRDPRTRERRKVGTGGKSRRKKQSPKR